MDRLPLWWWDRNVVVMGGLRDGEESYGARVQVPLLGKIPLLSSAFSKSHEQEQVELMVSITPRMVDTDE